MNGSDNSTPLPASVESVLHQICYNQRQTPPDDAVRRTLYQLGEEASLQILNSISKSTIKKTLSGYIMFMANKYKNSSSPNKAETKQSASPPAISTNGISHSPPVKRQLFSPTLSSEYPSTSRKRLHPQPLDPNDALNELEFRKAFLIRNYAGRARVEDAVTADDIRLWKDLPMREFESEVWHKLGRRYFYKKDDHETERIQYADWDSGMTHIYHCHVLLDGSYIYKGPFLSTSRTHLQRVLEDENVLQVKLAEEASGSDDEVSRSNCYSPAFNKIAEEGILIGLRRYRFFVFKDGGKEEKKKNPTSSSVKCFFVRTESLAPGDNEQGHYPLSNKNMRESRCLFMHVDMVSSMAKYMARFSLILSKTTKVQIDLSSVSVNVEDDIPCRDENGCIVYDENGEPLIHTDGTGFISEDLALQTPKECATAKNVTEENFMPLLMQIRLFYKGLAVKGTLLLNKLLPLRTIVIRPSMIKVQMDPRRSDLHTFDSLEIVKISEKPKKAVLSKNLIALLTYGGVPKECFLDLMESALNDAQTIYTNRRTATRASANHGEKDGDIVASMIGCGIPLNEPWLRSQLSGYANQERNGLKNGKLPISESFYLMGTADPTGMLERHQVCVIMENGQISGPVLVYRNPGLHFGDIHILEATYVAQMERFVGNAKYGIFFSTKGPRSVGSELANGDFDGDMYWVSRNAQLLSSFSPSEPWRRIYSTPSKPDKKKPSEMSADELEKELFCTFLRTRFKNSSCAGVAAESWIAHIDRLLILDESCANEKNQMKRSMHELVDVYYDALDAPKSGKQVVIRDDLIVRKFPHYMERPRTYNSTSVLGHLYDMVESYLPVESGTNGEDIWKLPIFNVEISPACMELWRERYNMYRPEMSMAMKSDDQEIRNGSASDVIQTYKQLLYDAPDFEDSPRNLDDIYNEAIAIYHACYNRAIQTDDVKACSFAWKVAGPALCEFCSFNDRSEKSRRRIIFLPSILREVL